MTEPTLIDFLRPRLDEHEKHIADLRAKTGEDQGLGGPWAPDGPDPVLADIAAKRQIITMCEASAREAADDPNNDEQVHFARGLRYAAELLALPYAAHPDYRPEWAPEVQS